MKNANYLRAALALGALTLIAGGTNAQTRGRATNGTTANGASNGTTNGVITRNPSTNGAAGGYYGGASNYDNGFYGNPLYNNGFNGSLSYGGGLYDANYVLGGNPFNYGYGGGYNNPYGSPYSGNGGMNGYSPYGPFASAYGNSAYGYGPNVTNDYYGNNGYYRDNAGNVLPIDPTLDPNEAPDPRNAAPNAGYNGQPGYTNQRGYNGQVTPAAARILPRTTDSIEAKRLKGDRFHIVWTGDNSAVNKITFAMLDLNKHAIMTRTVLQPPGEYTFPITSRMVYYSVVIEYVNGTTSTVTSPL